MATMSDSSETDAGSDGALSRISALILGGVLRIRGSFLLFVAAIGIVLEVVGLLMSESTLAGMFGIWGASALVYAVLGFVFLRLIGYH